jgi:hypothetical protein
MVIEGKVTAVRTSVIPGLSFIEIEEGSPGMQYASLRLPVDAAKGYQLGDKLRVTVEQI